MKFTRKELLSAGSHKWKESEVDAVTLRNTDEMVTRLNKLGYGPAMYASSFLRSLEDQKRINPKALGSSHLYGAAVDIADPDGKLAHWLQTRIGQDKLKECGLWMENPEYTPGWVHLQMYAPKSFNRVFNP